MFKQVSFDISNINNEEFEVRWKVSKNSKWPVIWNCQKWKGFLLKITSSSKLQMKFCPTWKLNIFLSHFQKVQDHEHLMNGWGDMVQSLPSVHGTSKGHNFWFITPNLVVLFAFCFSWHEVSKTSITLHEFPSYDHLCIQVNFGGKIINLKLVHHGNFLPLPMCLKNYFEWLWSSKCYCSRVHASHTLQFVIFCHAPCLD